MWDELLQVRGLYVLRSDTLAHLHSVLLLVELEPGGHVPDQFAVFVRDSSLAPVLSVYNVGRYKKADCSAI